MEHRDAEAADHGAEHDGGQAVEASDAEEAQTCEEDAERHEPRARLAVAEDAEKRLHDGREDVEAEDDHGHLRIGEAVVHHEEGQDRVDGALVDVGRQVPAHEDEAQFSIWIGRHSRLRETHGLDHVAFCPHGSDFQLIDYLQ